MKHKRVNAGKVSLMQKHNRRRALAFGGSFVLDVFGTSVGKPKIASLRSDAKSIGRDFKAVGDDFRRVLADEPCHAD